MKFSDLFFRPVLPEESVSWLLDGFEWAVREFGATPFFKQTPLVLPNEQFFPGQVKSQQEMAELVCSHVQRHAGLSHWPVRLHDHNLGELPTIESDQHTASAPVIYFEPQQVASPEVFIANLSHALAHHLGLQATTAPPCDEDQWFHMMELVGVYMGFGVMLANTAQPYRGGGCARCVSPLLERSGFLSEDEVTFALAIFTRLKGIGAQEGSRFLKKSLRPVFKRSLKTLEKHEAWFEKMKALQGDGNQDRYAALPDAGQSS